jgi:transposase-like protein
MLSDKPSMVLRKPKKDWKSFYTDKEKLEAAKLYLITGNQAATAAALNIHKNTMNLWTHSQWFKDLMAQLKAESNIKLSNKLKSIAEKALNVTEDRLENGEFIYDQKTGELRRKPMNGRDAHKIATDFLEKSFEVDKKQDRDQNEEATAGRLEQLADAFAKFASKTTKVEVVDVIPIEKEDKCLT